MAIFIKFEEKVFVDSRLLVVPFFFTNFGEYYLPYKLFFLFILYIRRSNQIPKYNTKRENE